VFFEKPLKIALKTLVPGAIIEVVGHVFWLLKLFLLQDIFTYGPAVFF